MSSREWKLRILTKAFIASWVFLMSQIFQINHLIQLENSERKRVRRHRRLVYKSRIASKNFDQVIIA